MFNHIYIEDAVREHPRTREILSRYPRASTVSCERYGEVFNRRAQNFRLQKRRPALILAEKHGNLVLETPPGYGIGAERNYYFSHMLNCIYDCRYCFLQGMYRSAHLVAFVNDEDFKEAIGETLASASGDACFFSGYDCDSLALDPVTGFATSFLDFFEAREGAFLELRTKSVQTAALLKRAPLKNVIVAFSLLPTEIAAELEPGLPSVKQRLSAITELQERGWPVGLRFDPLIADDDFESIYRDFFAEVFSKVNPETLHSVSLGAFRLPADFYKRIQRLYPEEKFLAGGLETRDGLVSYARDLGRGLLEFSREEILRYIPEDVFFPCTMEY